MKNFLTFLFIALIVNSANAQLKKENVLILKSKNAEYRVYISHFSTFGEAGPDQDLLFIKKKSLDEYGRELLVYNEPKQIKQGFKTKCGGRCLVQIQSFRFLEEEHTLYVSYRINSTQYGEYFYVWNQQLENFIYQGPMGRY